MARQGDDFHQLIEILEKVISGSPGIQIEAPKFLTDRVTGRAREHDIVLTYTYPNREVLVAIECRDRSRKIGVNQVEEFHQKCLDSGVSKGVIVTSKGFAGTAIEKARFYGIDCLSLAEVGQLDWCHMQGFFQHCREVKHSHIQFDISAANKEALASDIDSNFKLFEKLPDGSLQEITQENSNALVQSALSSYSEFAPDGEERTITICAENAGNFFVQDTNGMRVPVDRMTFTITFQTKVTQTPVRYFSYGSLHEGRAHSVVMAGVNVGPHEGEIVMLRKDDSIEVHYVPKVVALPVKKASKKRKQK